LVEPHWYEDPAAAIGRLDRAATLLVADRAGHPLPDLPLRATPLPTPAWVPERSATQARPAAAPAHPGGGPRRAPPPGPGRRRPRPAPRRPAAGRGRPRGRADRRLRPRR